MTHSMRDLLGASTTPPWQAGFPEKRAVSLLSPEIAGRAKNISSRANFLNCQKECSSRSLILSRHSPSLDSVRMPTIPGRSAFV